MADGSDLIVRVTSAADSDQEELADQEDLAGLTRRLRAELLTGATARQQEQLINVWLARHAPGS